MKVVPLCELMPSRIPSVNPGTFPDEQFTLWSIPSYDAGKPEQLFGREIGSSKKTVQNGDVLLSKIVPHIRRAWKVSVSNGHRQIASSEWITFRHGAFLSDFIRHFLLTDQFHAQFMGTVAGVGGSLLRAQPKSVAKIGIPLPPLDEQRRIVGLLDRAAEIRRRADTARAKACAIIPALFLDMFGDPATNPKGWQIATVDKLANVELRNGISPSKSGTVTGKVLTLSAITRGSFDPAALKESMFAAQLAAEQSVSRASFLICRGNGNPELVGRGAFPTTDMPDTAFPDTMIALRGVSGELSPAYLSALWATDFMRGQIKAAAKTTNGTYKIS